MRWIQLNKVTEKIKIGIPLFLFLFLLPHFVLAEIRVSTKDASCDGNSDGEATISVIGASGNFEYSIDGASYQSSGTFTGLSKGGYTAYVREAGTKCEFNKGFSIGEASQISVSVSGGGTHEFCDNENPPEVTLSASASGGSGELTYSWPDQSLTVSSSGTYTVTVSDTSGCTAERSAQVAIVPIVCSRDPNDIVGPPGVGPEKWVAKKDILPYTIRFENDPEFASAPAQVVRINQVLDPNVNMYTLKLGSFGFSNFYFEVPDNRNYYTTRLDVVDSLGVYVDVVAGIDVNKNEVFWVFRSIDPETGLDPSDASKGFLLINDSITHKGEGFVSYTIKPKGSASTGDSIYAEADIVFDINEAILTPKIFNTIDALPPTSVLDSIWVGVDGFYSVALSAHDENGEGSGVAEYDLYVSENNATYSLMAKSIPIDSSYLFKGKAGSEYCIFSQAKDSVGNIESGKTSGEICVLVPASPIVRLVQPLGGQDYCAGSEISVKWETAAVDKVNLYYYTNSSDVQLIASQVSASDSIFSWEIPSEVQEGQYFIKITDASNSELSAESFSSFDIHTKAEPILVSSKGDQFCFGETSQVTLQQEYLDYYWSVSGTALGSASSISVTSSGTYAVEVLDSNGCSAKDSMAIVVEPFPDKPLITPSDTIVCTGDSVTLSLVDDYSSYLWSTGETNPTIVVKISGEYSAVVADGKGCSGTSETALVIVKPNPENPLIQVVGKSTICQDSCAVLSTHMEDLSYLWSNGAVSQSIRVHNSGWYSLIVSDEYGCSSKSVDSVHITKLSPMTVSAGNSRNVYPAYPDAACTELSADVSGRTSGYSILWNTGVTASSINVCPEEASSYSVVVTDTNGCIARDTVQICPIDISCGTSAEPKVYICQPTVGGPLDVCVALDEVADYLAEGSNLGLCDAISPCTNDTSITSNLRNKVESAFLLEAFPNPMFGSTTIRFSLPNDDHVILKVVNVSGIEVSKVFEGLVEKGKEYRMNFVVDENVASGIYFYKLTTQKGEVFVKKLLLIK